MSDNLILAALARLEAGHTRLEAGHTRLEAGQTSLRDDVASLREDVASLRADVGRFDVKQTSLRVDIMERMDRLQNSLTDIRNDISANFGSADAVKRANDNTREELRALGDVVSALYRKINSLETRVREITGDP